MGEREVVVRLRGMKGSRTRIHCKSALNHVAAILVRS
jgi:hypothetical protein